MRDKTEKETPELVPFQPPTMVEVDGKLVGFYFARGKYYYRVFSLWREGYYEEITHARHDFGIGNEAGIVQAIKDYADGSGLRWSYEPEYLEKVINGK